MKKKIFSKIDPSQEATRLGEEAVQKGNYKKAKDYFNLALKHNTHYEPALINLASLAIKEGIPQIASKYFESIANFAIDKQLYIKGIAALKRALQYDPTNQLVQEKLINILRIQYGAKDCEIPIASESMSPQPKAYEGVQSPQDEGGEFNLADLSEEEIDEIAEVEVLISEGAFEEAHKLLSPMSGKYSNIKYIKLLIDQIENRDKSIKSFIPVDSQEPEIDLSGAIK